MYCRCPSIYIFSPLLYVQQSSNFSPFPRHDSCQDLVKHCAVFSRLKRKKKTKFRKETSLQQKIRPVSFISSLTKPSIKWQKEIHSIQHLRSQTGFSHSISSQPFHLLQFSLWVLVSKVRMKLEERAFYFITILPLHWASLSSFAQFHI